MDMITNEGDEEGSQEKAIGAVPDVGKSQIPRDDKIQLEIDALANTQQAISDPVGDCNAALLDSMDGCVDYVEGVDSQYIFEKQQHAIRHNSLAVQDTAQALVSLSPLQDLDYLNLCGSEHDMNPAKAVESETPGTSADSFDDSKTSTAEKSATRPVPEESTHCAICFDEETDASKRIMFATLPCCKQANDSSSVKICTACVILLSTPTGDGSSRVGRCLRCRSWITVTTPDDGATDLHIRTVESSGQCRVCNQMKDHLVEDGAVCDACFIGRRHPLLYECGTCSATQSIPHPVYRYQSSPDEFGTITWACHGQCGVFTNWRILPDQVRLIPVGDAPEEWGADYLEAARARIQVARNSQLMSQQGSDTCFIL